MQLVTRTIRAAAILTGLLALLVGLPAGLIVYIGWPLPTHLPTLDDLRGFLTTPLSTTVLTNALACLMWAAWAAIALCVGTELGAGILHRPLPTWPGLGWAQALAGTLIGALSLTVTPAASATVHLGTATLATAVVHPGAATPTTPAGRFDASAISPHTEPPSSSTTATPRHPQARTSRPAGSERQRLAATGRHVVAPGESLWAIAAHQLGPQATAADVAARMHMIIRLNQRKLKDPDMIRPGWHLRLPARPHRPHHRPPYRRPTTSRPTPPATPSPSPSHAPTTSPAPNTPAPTETRPPPSGVDHTAHTEPVGFTRLQAGGLVGAALALALAAALALHRRRRRAAYTPSPPVPGRNLHTGAFPPVVRRLLHLAHRNTARTTPTAPNAPSPSEAPAVIWAGAIAPAQITAGASDGQPVQLDLLPYGGLLLTGPGAPACLRGLLSSLYARSGPGIDILLVDPAHKLLTTAPLPGIRTTGDWEQATAELEVASITRARTLSAHGETDYAASRRDHPEDPLPLLCLIITNPPPEAAERLAALTRIGPRHGIIVLADSPHPARSEPLTQAGLPYAHVGTTGQVDDAAPTDLTELLAGTHLPSMSADEAIQILQPLADARSPDPQPKPAPPTPAPPTQPAASQPHPPATPDPADSPSLHSTETDPTAHDRLVATATPQVPPADAPTPQETTNRTKTGSPEAHVSDPAEPASQAPPGPTAPATGSAPAHVPDREPVPTPEHHHATSATAWPCDATGQQKELDVPVRVRVLGPVQITVNNTEIRTGLRSSAREILVFYALRPDGAPLETAIDALWPDTPPEKGRRRAWAALSELRTTLRGPARPNELQIISRDGERYRIMASEVAIDLWDFQTILERAVAADDTEGEITALTDASRIYRGDLATDADYLWIEPAREDLHRRALDTHLRLAELHAALGHNQRALSTLETARELDPHAEETYRRLMRLYNRLSRPEAARRTFAQLREQLADLDITPSPATLAIVHKINEQLRAAAHTDSPTADTDPQQPAMLPDP